MRTFSKTIYMKMFMMFYVFFLVVFFVVCRFFSLWPA